MTTAEEVVEEETVVEEEILEEEEDNTDEVVVAEDRDEEEDEGGKEANPLAQLAVEIVAETIHEILPPLRPLHPSRKMAKRVPKPMLFPNQLGFDLPRCCWT